MEQQRIDAGKKAPRIKSAIKIGHTSRRKFAAAFAVHSGESPLSDEAVTRYLNGAIEDKMKIVCKTGGKLYHRTASGITFIKYINNLNVVDLF